MQCLYPLAHNTFRVAEVLLRVVTFTCLLVFLRTEVVLLIMAADFFAGFAALQWHSPDKEIFRVHMVVAFSLLVVDVTYFVDQPNFVLPARSISRNVLQLRLSAPLLFSAFGVLGRNLFGVHTFTPSHLSEEARMWAGLECPSDGRTDTCPGQVLCLVPCLCLLYASRRIIACELLGLSELFARKSPVS